MSYKTIIVNLDIAGHIAPVVKAASDLAGRFQARLIGLCAADAPLPFAGPESVGLAAETWMRMRDDIQTRVKALHERFVELVAGKVVAEWREALDNPTRALAEAARAADLIVMGAVEGAATGDAYRQADPASIALQAGRPVLVIARETEQVQARNIAVAWKDTREARRALADSLPLLKSAETVTVVTVASEVDQRIRQSLADVMAFLGGHGIEARSKPVEGSDEHLELFQALDESGAALIVSGAYGHSRLREWACGGVTRSLLDQTGRNRFMAS